MMEENPGIFKVVGEHELEKHTREGWVLIKVLKESVLQSSFDTVPAPVPPGGYASSGTVGVTTHHEVQIHKFLLRQETESALTELTVQVSVLTGQLAEAKKNWDAENKTAKDLAQKLAVENTNNARLVSERDECRRIAEANAEKVRRMEEDFGKVWQGVGEFSMKQILGTEATNPRPAPPDQRRTAYERITKENESEEV